MHAVVEMHASRSCLIPIERERVIIKYVTLYEIADAGVNEL